MTDLENKLGSEDQDKTDPELWKDICTTLISGLVIAAVTFCACYFGSEFYKKRPVQSFTTDSQYSELRTRHNNRVLEYTDKNRDNDPDTLRIIKKNKLEKVLDQEQMTPQQRQTYTKERDRLVQYHVDRFLELGTGKLEAKLISISKTSKTDKHGGDKKSSIIIIHDKLGGKYIAHQRDGITTNLYFGGEDQKQKIRINSNHSQQITNIIKDITSKITEHHIKQTSVFTTDKILNNPNNRLTYQSFGNKDPAMNHFLTRSINERFKFFGPILAQMNIDLEQGYAFFLDDNNDNKLDGFYLRYSLPDNPNVTYCIECIGEQAAETAAGIFYKKTRDEFIKSHVDQCLEILGNSNSYPEPRQKQGFVEVYAHNDQQNLNYVALRTDGSGTTTYFKARRGSDMNDHAVFICNDKTPHMRALIGNIVDKRTDQVEEKYKGE